MITDLSGIILILLVLLAGFELFRLRFFWKNHRNPNPSSWPMVSVLVAARNEEDYLPRLLLSLEALNYPEEQIEFLVIDDQSVDQTGELINEWCKEKSNRKGFKTPTEVHESFRVNGKAAALSILCDKAKGEFLFFTDADCQVNLQWIKEGVSCFSPQTGIVIGITKVEATSRFEIFQELDWWNTLGQVKVAADLDLQTTGLGNNMIIRKSAYDQSGGFKLTVKSLTEDLEISKLVHKTGHKLVHQISAHLLTLTKAEPSLMDLLNQRKRWFSGVLTLPLYWLLLLNLQFLYLPALLVFTFNFPFTGIMIFLLKIGLQGSMIHKLRTRTNQEINWVNLLFFDFYSFLINALTILYYFYPSKIRWKSRSYP